MLHTAIQHVTALPTIDAVIWTLFIISITTRLYIEVESDEPLVPEWGITEDDLIESVHEDYREGEINEEELESELEEVIEIQ